jgi:hypothetical protein
MLIIEPSQVFSHGIGYPPGKHGEHDALLRDLGVLVDLIAADPFTSQWPMLHIWVVRDEQVYSPMD